MKHYQRFMMRLGSFMPQKLQLFVYKRAGMKLGNKIIIKDGFYTDEPSKMTLGNNVYFNGFVRAFFGVNSDAHISIGNNVYIGPNVSLLCVTHEIGNEIQRAGKTIHGSIEIEDGAWIGANAVIFPGVKICAGG